MKTDFTLLLFLAALTAVGLASTDDRTEVIKFMRRQKILPKCRKEEGKTIDQCISDLKRYCGMQRVGNPEITEELLACVRGGIKCVEPPKPNATNSGFYNPVWREKFYKQHLTYFLENRPARSRLRQDELQKMADMAVSVWECYTQLKFTPVYSIREADIIISFMTRQHGTYNYFTKQHKMAKYPFDGPGGVLAHAFLPYGGSSNTGNFHYDDEETWIEDHKTGTKLLHVTVHELGHNLGLNHIAQRGNIMYPMYDDSYHETQLDLGPHDIYEIQARYGARRCTRKIWQEYYEDKFPNPQRNCKDISPNCRSITYDRCLADRQWMKKNCAKHCGFCGSCENLLNRCGDYHYNGRCPKKDPWFLHNCKRMCNMCAAKEPEFLMSNLPADDKQIEESREQAQKPRQCIDLFKNCKQYSKAYCESKVHYIWMFQNCRKYCGMCDKCSGSNCPSKPGNQVPQNKHQVEICRAKKLDGIFKTPSGALYIILDGFLYRRGSRDKTVSPVFKMKISDLAENGPKNPTAASFSRKTKLLYLFEGNKLFVIKHFQDPKREMTTYVLPKKLSSATAAFVLNRGPKDDIKVYKNGKVITFRTKGTDIKILKHQSFESIFDAGDYTDRIPRAVDGAFQVNKKLRFITGSSVTVAYQQEDGRYSLPASSVTPFGTEYLNCPQT